MRRVPGRVQHSPRAGVSPLIWLRFLAFPLVLLAGLWLLARKDLKSQAKPSATPSSQAQQTTAESVSGL